MASTSEGRYVDKGLKKAGKFFLGGPLPARDVILYLSLAALPFRLLQALQARQRTVVSTA